MTNVNKESSYNIGMRNTIWVRAGEHGWVDANEVEIEDVSEDFRGYDVYTFEYKGETYTSNAVSGSRPG